MSGWGTDNNASAGGWGPATTDNNASAGGWGPATTDNNASSGGGWGGGDGDGAWGAGDNQDGQPEDGEAEVERRPPRPAPFETRDAPIGAWAEKTAYNYDDFGDSAEGGVWDGNARVYEWDGEEGDIGPKHPELEEVLFGKPEDRDPQGIDFSKIAMIDVSQEGINRVHPIYSFADAGLHPAMMDNIKMAGYQVPTPIQKYTIPAIKMGNDVIAIAQTGSGKTAAYLIPILDKLMGKAKKLAAPRPNPADLEVGHAAPVRAEPLVVIVVPARELAVQIFNEARKFCYRTMLRPCVVYGGGPLRDQIAQLSKGCDILIASPGRLIDMMERPHLLTLRRVRYMVIDEADEMLHSDWEEEFNKILSGGEQEEGNVNYMLFSATFPVAVRKLAKTHLAESHIRLRVGRIGSTHENIKQDVVWVDPHQKKQALLDYIYSKEPARTIIFVNIKRVADELDDFLFHSGMPVTSMHADRTQREREDAMRAFRSGKTPILVTTGVAARGIDVRNVKYVINYDLPSMEHGGITEYTHRIGRTGRIGARGEAMSFYTDRDEPIAELLTQMLIETNQEIPDFLQHHAEGKTPGNMKFEPDSDEVDDPVIPGPGDAAGGSGGGGDAWGGDDGAAAGGDAWGSGGGGGWNVGGGGDASW